MSPGNRIPLWITTTPLPAAGSGLALILTGANAAPPGYAIVRHADAAAVAQAGACRCCRVPSALATLLRQLFLDRVRGDAEFDGVVIEAPQSLVADAMAEPLVAARYEIQPPYSDIQPQQITATT